MRCNHILKHVVAGGPCSLGSIVSCQAFGRYFCPRWRRLSSLEPEHLSIEHVWGETGVQHKNTLCRMLLVFYPAVS